MSILSLNSQHFRLSGDSKKTLNIGVGGNILVFFKMQGCQGCAAFEPAFVQLSRQDQRVKYAVVDVSTSKEVVTMSHQTNTPIQSVPHLILYVNGRPHARFKGKKNIPAVQSFITKALQAVPAQVVHTQGMHQMHSQAAPQQQHFMPPPQAMRPQGATFMPEFGTTPSMNGLKNRVNNDNKNYGMADDDEDDQLQIPDAVVPHNVPWEADKKMM